MDNNLQEIKDRLNIAEVIGGYIQIKKSGTNFKAPCPFHNEKTPSLMISPQKQIWHCFGCGEGGDIFGFVMRYENLDFKEALKVLADKAGVKLPEYKPRDIKEESEKELLYRINDFAARFYHQILLSPQGEKALEYLKNRGLSLATIKQWQIGFAPEDFHILEKALVQKKIPLDLLVKAGVSAKNERGQIYDRFRGRVTFPIFDYNGKTVGFSARILLDDGKSAKYVNSPETIIYNKSKILFGLNFAKNDTRKKDEAVVVEGQMDCISAHQAGFANVVASSGTALTADQLQIIGRMTKNLKFCFDGDSAGLNAARRAGEIALRQGFRLKLITLKVAKDPDELIKKSPGLWEKAVKEAVWFIDYYIDLAQTQAPQDSVSQVHYISEQVVPLLGFVADPLEQDHYIKKITEKFGISEKVVRQQIKPHTAVTELQKGGAVKKPGAVLEKEILGGMLLFPDFLQRVVSEGKLEYFDDLEIRRIIEPVFISTGTVTLQAIDTVAKEALFMVESLLDELGKDEEILKRQLAKSFALLRLSAIKRSQLDLSLEIKNAETAKNKEKLKELNQRFAESSSLRMQLEKEI